MKRKLSRLIRVAAEELQRYGYPLNCVVRVTVRVAAGNCLTVKQFVSPEDLEPSPEKPSPEKPPTPTE